MSSSAATAAMGAYPSQGFANSNSDWVDAARNAQQAAIFEMMEKVAKTAIKMAQKSVMLAVDIARALWNVVAKVFNTLARFFGLRPGQVQKQNEPGDPSTSEVPGIQSNVNTLLPPIGDKIRRNDEAIDVDVKDVNPAADPQRDSIMQALLEMAPLKMDASAGHSNVASAAMPAIVEELNALVDHLAKSNYVPDLASATDPKISQYLQELASFHSHYSDISTQAKGEMDAYIADMASKIPGASPAALKEQILSGNSASLLGAEETNFVIEKTKAIQTLEVAKRRAERAAAAMVEAVKDKFGNSPEGRDQAALRELDTVYAHLFPLYDNISIQNSAFGTKLRPEVRNSDVVDEKSVARDYNAAQSTSVRNDHDLGSVDLHGVHDVEQAKLSAAVARSRPLPAGIDLGGVGASSVAAETSSLVRSADVGQSNPFAALRRGRPGMEMPGDEEQKDRSSHSWRNA